jgi:nucleotide-binding universal stress UspA family protein
MIPKIKNILYATDLSKNSAYAFRYAINSAVHHGADIHILHVLEIRLLPASLPGDEGTGTLYEGPLYVDKMQKIDAAQKNLAKKRIQKRLEDFCQQELEGNSDLLKRVVSIEITEGDPAAQILQKADELPADLVIMGTHGKGLLAHTFLGSVAEKVLHRIKIPVFIIPIPKETDIALSDM